MDDEYKENKEAGVGEKPSGFQHNSKYRHKIFLSIHVLDFALLLHAAAAGGKWITTFRRNLLPLSSRLDSDFELLIRNNDARNSISKTSHPQL
jgi:hypothetical protein